MKTLVYVEKKLFVAYNVAVPVEDIVGKKPLGGFFKDKWPACTHHILPTLIGVLKGLFLFSGRNTK